MNDAEAQIVAIEQAALRRWCAGDPSGFLEICDDDVVYFDPFLDRRLDGLAALAAYYEPLRGKVFAPRFQMLDPKVQQIGDAAVLTFNFVCYDGDDNVVCWNCTEVFRRRGETWKLAQTHWSFTRGRRG